MKSQFQKPKRPITYDELDRASRKIVDLDICTRAKLLAVFSKYHCSELVTASEFLNTSTKEKLTVGEVNRVWTLISEALDDVCSDQQELKEVEILCAEIVTTAWNEEMKETNPGPVY